MFSRLVLKLGVFLCLSFVPLAHAQAQVLKVATLAPDGTGWMQEMRRGAQEIERRTQKRVSFKFYPGGIMGNEKAVLKKMQIGQLHAAALTANALALIYPENQIYSLPLGFNTYGETDYVRERMDRDFIAGLNKRGYTAFGLSEGGFIYLMSSEPIRRLSDLKQQKVWIPEGDIIVQTLLENMGITPVILPITDVLTGLQTGLITTVGATPSFAIAVQWHTKVKYMTDMPILYSFGALAVNNKAFKKISRADQTIVREVMEGVFKKLNDITRKDNESAKLALKKRGIEFVVPEPEDLQELHGVAAETSKDLINKGAYTQEMLNTVRGYLEAYRNGKAARTAQR